MRYFKYLLLFVVIGVLSSCDLFDEPDLPIPMDETLDNTGAFLRVLTVESDGFDYLDLENSEYSFTGEIDDIEDGDTVEDIEFFVSYDGVDGSAVEEELVKTVNVDDMDRSEESGLYRKTFVITAEDAVEALGISFDDVMIGDDFGLRWKLNLHDGRSFTAGDGSGDVEGGGFYNSPFQSTADVFAKIPEDLFVGEYEFTQVEGESIFSDSDHPDSDAAGDYLYNDSESFVAELEVNEDNPRDGRVFVAAPYEEAGGEAVPQQISFMLANDEENNAVTMDGDVGTGFICAVGVNFGPESEQISQFELEDDGSFTLVINENSGGDCGISDQDIVFEVNRVN